MQGTGSFWIMIMGRGRPEPRGGIEPARRCSVVPERLGECAALKTLNLEGCSSLIALPERLGECAA